MCSAKRSYHSALASAAATSFSTIGRRAASKLFNALSILASVLRAFASAIASSIARRVPEPIEKCAVRSASPINTTFPADHRALRKLGKLRHTDLFDTRRCPPRVCANTVSQYFNVSASFIVAKPARCHVAASHSTTKVLITGACRKRWACNTHPIRHTHTDLRRAPARHAQHPPPPPCSSAEHPACQGRPLHLAPGPRATQ